MNHIIRAICRCILCLPTPMRDSHQPADVLHLCRLGSTNSHSAVMNPARPSTCEDRTQLGSLGSMQAHTGPRCLMPTKPESYVSLVSTRLSYTVAFIAEFKVIVQKINSDIFLQTLWESYFGSHHSGVRKKHIIRAICAAVFCVCIRQRVTRISPPAFYICADYNPLILILRS